MADLGYLILENGQVFEGVSFGSEREVKGEAVFNTGMVGYPEGFTDPSYQGQILTMTYPLIGNYGVSDNPSTEEGIPDKFESGKIHISGLIVSEYIDNSSHWDSVMTLSAWLKKNGIPALTGIDTRSLTKILRQKGVMKAILTFKKPRNPSGFIFEDINKRNLVSEVSLREKAEYGKGRNRILFIDCGHKANQLKLLLKLDTSITRVPWDHDFMPEIRRYDGIFISNGPGDPKKASITINNLKKAMSTGIPVFGICLGNQLMALAAGADTYKLKYGHRGQNQPVIDVTTGKCYVTTHNHGFAVDEKTLGKDWTAYFRNLNDGTNEGIMHKKLPFFSVQFHPESMPGPTDTEWLFSKFIELVSHRKRK